MVRKFQILFVFLLVIFSFRFFEATFLDETNTTYLRFIFTGLAILISIPFINRKQVGFVFPIQLIFTSMLISIFVAYYYLGQEFMDSVKSTVPLMLWLFFFYLLYVKFPISILENVILIYGALYVVLHFYQLANPQTVLFGWLKVITEDRGVLRFIIPGNGIFTLATFIVLNKFYSAKQANWLWFPFVCIGLIIPFLQATRQLIISALVIYVIHFIQKLHILKKTIVIVFLIFSFYFLLQIDNPIIKGILDVQKETIGLGKDYIRVQSGIYFLKDFSKNTINYFFGNGVPYGDKSDYGKSVMSLQKKNNYYLADIGIISIYAMFGILAVIAYIIIWIKSFVLKVPDQYRYVKYYLWFLLITCLTSDYTYSLNNLIANVFALYIYQRVYVSKNNSGNRKRLSVRASQRIRLYRNLPTIDRGKNISLPPIRVR